MEEIIYRATTLIVHARGLSFCRGCGEGVGANLLTYKGTETRDPKGSRCATCHRPLWEKVS